MGNRLKCGSQLLKISPGRQFQYRIGDEQVSALGRGHDRSFELINAHLLLRKHVRDFVDDAGMVLACELERNMGSWSRRSDRCSSFRSDRKQAPGLDGRKFVEHGVDRRIGQLHQDDAGELAGKFGKMASVPISTVCCDNTSDGVDQSRPVVANKRDHHRSHGKIVVPTVTWCGLTERNTDA